MKHIHGRFTIIYYCMLHVLHVFFNFYSVKLSIFYMFLHLNLHFFLLLLCKTIYFFLREIYFKIHLEDASRDIGELEKSLLLSSRVH